MNETTQVPAPLLLDAHAAANALAIGERTLARLTAAGQIPVVQIGRLVRFDPHDLTAWIESRKADAGARP